MENIVKQFLTLVSEESYDGALISWKKSTYMVGNERRIVLEERNVHGKNTRETKFNVVAEIHETYTHVWYDGDGEEHVEEREWKRVYSDYSHDHCVNTMLAAAYGVLMCYR